MKTVSAIVSSGLLLIVGACAYSNSVLVLNNTPADIDVTIREVGGSRIVSSRIKAGNERPLRSDAAGSPEGWEIEISSDNCVWEYNLRNPSGDLWSSRNGSHLSPREHTTIRVQFEPDRRIYVVPPNTKAPVDVTQAEVYQFEGFPLQPLSETCAQ
ncbi:MAG: hypothetical protein ACK4MQ_09475 [Hyphomonas sp.]